MQQTERGNMLKYNPGNIRNIRKDAGMTQAELAEAIGVRRQRVSELETSACGINVKTLERLAAALRVTDANLFFVLKDAECKQ